MIVPFLESVGPRSTEEELLAAMEVLEPAILKEVPWPDFPYCPLVRFRVAHTGTGIVLLYNVAEKHVRAHYRHINDPVYKDSCVEFFLSFDGVNYYNMEFNSLGVGLIGYGPAVKAARKRLPAEMVSQVRSFGRVRADPSESGGKEWQLLLQIPVSVFEAETIDTLAGLRCTANFYKCGDDLPEPHYVAWNPISYPVPNFHLPRYFGILQFSDD